MKILIIEKSVLLTGRIRSLLEEAGELISIYSTNTYIETNFLLRELTPDIVLLDVSLPNQSARILYRNIRLKNKSAVFIIMLSRRNDPEKERNFFTENCYLLDKYHDSSCIIPCVKQIIQSNKKQLSYENRKNASPGTG